MMHPALFRFLECLLASVGAGLLGSLVGLGGAMILIPMYVIALSIPIKYASGASLVATIATSCGAGSAYVKAKLANARIGIGLLTATTSGALVGTLAAAYIYSHNLTKLIYLIFGCVMIFSIYTQISKAKYEVPKPLPPDRTTDLFKLYGRYFDPALGREVVYHGVRWHIGWGIMFAAGFLSGLLGIGSGALKVLGMDWAMNLPIKVTTATSNFMIGVTAATSSSMYWILGFIDPVLAAATALGVFLGSLVGGKILPHVKNRVVRLVFMATLAVFGVEMILKGLGIYP